ncbi:MAG: hypothetical protein ABI534_04050 [Chloroflexota bacterium]
MKPKFVVGALGVASAGVVVGTLLMANVPAPATADDAPAHVDDVALDVDNAARAYAVDHLSARYMSMDAIWLDDQLREALPNVEFSIDGSAAQPAYGGVVEGQVTAVAEGASYRDEVGPDGARSAQLPFDSPDATWRMIVLTIDVENDFDPTTEAPETVRLGVTFDGGADAKSMLSAFEGQHVLAVLDRPGAFSADQTVRTAARSGALLGFVAEDGSISMPLLGEDERDYLNVLTTINALIAESEKPKSIINVTFDRGYQRGG